MLPSAEMVVQDDYVPAGLTASSDFVGPLQTADAGEEMAYATVLSELDGAGRVESASGIFVGGERVADSVGSERFRSAEGVWYTVVPDVEPISAQGEDLVRSIRALPGPDEVLVGGESARLVDNKAEIWAKLPAVIAWVGIALLLVVTGFETDLGLIQKHQGQGQSLLLPS